MSEIGVKLSGDNSAFVGMLDDSVQKGDQFAENLATRVGDRLVGLRHVSTAVATALGLNLENITQNIARLFTGMSKEEEDFYNKTKELSDRQADTSIKNMRDRATEETKYQLLLQERKRLEGLLADQADEEVKAAGIFNATLKETGSLEQARAAAMSANWDAGKRLNEVTANKLKLDETGAAISAAEDKRKKAALEEFLKTAADGAKDGLEAQKEIEKEGSTAAAEQKKFLDATQSALEKQYVANEKLIQQAREKAIAEASVLTEFEKQLDAIQKMSGNGTQGFQASSSGGGVGTTTIGTLRTAADNARNALKSLSISDPDYARKYIEAQAAVDQADKNVSIGQGYQGLGSTPTPVPTSALSFSPVSAVADAALGSRASIAAQIAVQNEQKSIQANSLQALLAINRGLVAAGITTETTIQGTGNGGAPDTSGSVTGGGLFFGG